MTDAADFLERTRADAGRALTLAMAAAAARGGLAIPFAWLLAGAIDRAAFHKADATSLAPTLFALVALVLLRLALALLTERAAVMASARARAGLFRRLLAHVRALGPIRLAGQPTGEMVAALTDAVAALDPFWRRYLPALASGAALPVLILLAVTVAEWRAALVFLIGAPVAVLFLVLVGQGAEKASQKQWGNLTRLGGSLLDAVQGLADLKIFRASKAEIAIVAQMAEAYRRDTMAVLRLAFLSALALEFFTALAIALVAVLVGFRLLWGEMHFHAGLFILLLAPEFYAPLRALGVERHAKMEAIAAAEKIVALLDRPAPARPRAPLTPVLGKAAALRFDNVSFSYDGGPPALENFSLDIAGGEHVAVVGPSGAGKSTILSLLLGFIQPTSGRILADGFDLAEIDLALWRAQIAFVPQSPHFFDGDIARNVAMGRAPPDGDVASAVARALRDARAETVVAHLPQGVNTPLGEGGLGLSGGEAQRIALARAFFLPAPLILFDEPTAHLDSATERELQHSFARLAVGRTALTIAHRLETAKKAGRLIVLDRGHMVEAGAHEALVAAGGLYARLAAADLAPPDLAPPWPEGAAP
ncbi:thiol reductant ABC exporter subunit CydD [Candidatus Rhodoblastus alkanivorans]|uniref:Thiol reductant ABC exporter subunit CydD n=1 Tax=Candidatus Rhodoblastus alkanivorans TaxID=2954117 RepID=A0ABS9Z331_9HYPH|nr:thiol reductant ABC exporter subunit CydD [Candidatus Rhodoblastus alkanivorans]MCI4682069.1 thiol reductant ABC exporter subunit CydD [Candidatus Rhodoblastus alkanivorans]